MRIIPVPTGKPQAAQKRGQKKEKRSKKADNSPAPPLAWVKIEFIAPTCKKIEIHKILFHSLCY